ncbi:MAG: hypothetical protein HOK84_03780 [Bacteroidetes bacterium]|nr:hypothetical protein [Bacteroidota bacterium]
MKNALIFTFCFLISVMAINQSYGQAPQAFRYQSVVRNAEGIPLSEKLVGVMISIYQDGTEVYTETHTKITNPFGIINLDIGKGSVSAGSFEGLEWGSGTFSVKVSIDPNGGSNYSIVGSSELLSVPYAFYAENSSKSDKETDPVFQAHKAYGILDSGSGDVITMDERDQIGENASLLNGNPGVVSPELALIAGPGRDLGMFRYLSSQFIKMPATSEDGGIMYLNNLPFLHGYGTNNTFLGNYAGNFIMGAVGNTGLGAYSLTENLTGNNNTAVGLQTLQKNTAGSGNVALGHRSLQANTDGMDNTSVGAQSLSSNTTGSSNTVIGGQALVSNQTGMQNTVLGYNSGFSSLGSGNVFIGYEAGFYETGSDKLYIDNSLTNSPLIYGEFANRHLTINGTMNVTGATAFNGELTFQKGVTMESWFIVHGYTVLNNKLKVTYDTESDDVGTGALVVSGGLGLGKRLNVGGTADIAGITRLNNTAESTSKDDGSLIVEGGVGIEKRLNVGGDTDVTGITRLNNSAESTSKDDGSLIVEGGVGIEKRLNVGGDTDVTGITRLNNSAESTSKDDGSLIVEGGVGIEKRLNVGGDTDVTGITRLNNTTQSTAVGNGSLVALGGASIAKDLSLGNNLNVYQGNVSVQAGNLLVSGSGSAGPDSKHVAMFTNNDSDGHGVGIKLNNTKPSGDNNFMTFYNSSNGVAGRIEGFVPDDFSYPFTPAELVDIVIPDWTEFFPIGKIVEQVIEFEDWEVYEGAELGDWCLDYPDGIDFDFDIDFWDADFDLDISLSWDEWCINLPDIPALSVPIPVGFKEPDWSTLFNPLTYAINQERKGQLDQLLEWAISTDNTDLMALDPFEIALALYMTYKKVEFNDGGVVFGSKGADYAEWLPKLDTSEIFLPGQIVGVFDGQISAKTSGADQIMSISKQPVIVGNIPPKEQEHNYERIGFMGQVPVLVSGKVEAGDYIIPSGLNDGTGIAIKPGNLKLEHLDQILGKALTASENGIFDLITAMVGVKTNEWAEMFRKQAGEIEALKSEINLLSGKAEQYQILEAKAVSLEAENQAMKNDIELIKAQLNTLMNN